MTANALASFTAAIATSLALLLLAGCMTGAPDPAAEGADDRPASTTAAAGAGAPGASSAPIPTWRLRDFWTFQNSGGLQVTFVVTGETASDWFVDTTAESYAFFGAAVDDSSWMGEQRKDDLAGSEGAARVEFFQWPLEDGASWTTRWDGAERTITAEHLGGQVFLMEARNADGSLYASYEYDPVAGWFRTFDFYGPDGTLQFGHVLVASGHDWTGEVVRYTVREVAVIEHAFDPAAPPVAQELLDFAVEAGEDVFLLGGVTCTAGAFRFVVAPQDAPNDGHTTEIVPCPGNGSFFGPAGDTPGPWRLHLAFAGTPADAGWFAHVFLRTRIGLAVG